MKECSQIVTSCGNCPYLLMEAGDWYECKISGANISFEDLEDRRTDGDLDDPIDHFIFRGCPKKDTKLTFIFKRDKNIKYISNKGL